MWHEARRQERKIRGIMVDFKRRADRRREFYEKIKQDPTQFLRMYGRPAKIHLDSAVSLAAEGPQSMMPWQGDSTNMIDRFDVRANLDIIPPYLPDKNAKSESIDEEERFANYERYRTLVENDAAGLSEEQCLHQIYLDEHFGTITKPNEEEKKKNADKKAAIGFVYEDSTPAVEKDEEEEEESEDDIELADLDITIDVDDLTPDEKREVNLCAVNYGMKGDDFSRLLKKDKEELELLKEARQLEEAKAQFSGRKSRRERRAINEKRQNPQRFSRPSYSYAARESPKYEPYERPGSVSRSRSRSSSRSHSSEEAAPVTFITSFGAESEEESGVVQGPLLPSNMKSASEKDKSSVTQSSKCETPWLSSAAKKARDIGNKRNSRGRSNKSSSRSKSRSRSRSKSSRSSSRSRSRSHPRLRHRTSKSSSRSISPRKSRSRSRNRSETRRDSRGRLDRRGSRTSRGRTRSSSSSSRSRSRSSQRRSSKRSLSPSKKPVAVKRYRRDSLSSKSELSGLESDEETDKNGNSSRSSPSSRVGTSITKSDLTKSGKIDNKQQPTQVSMPAFLRETPKERLKRRMQAQLSRQFKADKKAEISKITKQEQERLDREEEIRVISMEIRRREREKRHKEREEEQDDSDADSDSEKISSPDKNRRPAPDRRDRDRPSKREDRSSPERKEDRRREDNSRSVDKRRSPPHRSQTSVDSRSSRSEDRHSERHREPRSNSRWEDRDRRDYPSSSSSSRRDRDMGRRPPSRWEDDRPGRHSTSSGGGLRGEDWGRQRYGAWDDGPADHYRGQTGRPSSGYNSNGRPRVPLLQRSRSPLMSRPRPPRDPSLLDEGI